MYIVDGRNMYRCGRWRKLTDVKQLWATCGVGHEISLDNMSSPILDLRFSNKFQPRLAVTLYRRVNRRRAVLD